MAGRFPFPIPNGWFGLRYADELAPGTIETVRAFGTELVAFRGEDGAAHVLDAHCPHLGAHLGVGGSVVGGALRCPFHAWEWDGATGACTKIPYAKRIPPNARLRSWTTVERNGIVFVWYHAEGKEPDFEIPEFPEATSPDWSDPDRYEFTVRSHNQEMGENAVDSAHFRTVHGTLNVPPAEISEDGPRRRSLQHVEMKTPRGEIRGAIEVNQYGMGFAATRFTGICETFELACTTPIDEESVVLRYAFRQPRVNGQNPTGGVAAALIRDLIKQTKEDIPIWENKVHRARPLLCEEEAPIAAYRAWCRQFYSAPRA